MVGLGALLLLAGAAQAEAGGFDVRIGGFFPRGRDCGVPFTAKADLTLFQDVCDLYTVNASDFDGLYGGVEYNHVLVGWLEAGVSWDYYAETTDSSYRDAPGVRQSLRLRSAPLGLTLRVLPTGKKAKVVPFLGGGVDAVFWRYEEYGDFIDFFDPEQPVLWDAFTSDGTAFGVHAVGGLRVYLNRDFAVVGEGRYQWAEDEMGDDFSPNAPGEDYVNRIDLSGWSFTVGVHVRF
jgi:hypothetical protein